MDLSEDLRSFLPDNLSVYEVSSEESYTKENLYDYINGGAELFNSYGFKKLLTRTYNADGQPEIIVDIFDMGTSQDAFGVFSYSMHKHEKDYGQGSQSSKGMIVFWMDRYYVSIIAYPETDLSKKAVNELAGSISAKIGKYGELPVILNYLPEEGISRESIKYFRHYVWLNSLYFISHDNILRIQDDTPSVLAKYGDNMSKTILLLVSYPENDQAVQALDNFKSHYLSGHSGVLPLKIEDGTYVHYRLKEDLLAVVFNAGSPEECLVLLDGVEELYQK